MHCTWGSLTPFFGVGTGWGWNQWVTQGLPPYSARIANALVTRMELGLSWGVSEHLALESVIGFQENDPLGSVNLPYNAGGMDEEFQMSFFFAEIGFRFSL